MITDHILSHLTAQTWGPAVIPSQFFGVTVKGPHRIRPFPKDNKKNFAWGICWMCLNRINSKVTATDIVWVYMQ